MQGQNPHSVYKLALCCLLSTPITPLMADTVMRFGDNTNPSPVFPSGSGVNTTPFMAGAEFRMVDPGGNIGGGQPAQKNLLSGNESWTFDDVTGQLLSVANTGTANGLSSSILYYIDQGYIAPATCRDGGCPGLFKSVPFLGINFDFIAPLAGTVEGNTYGPAQLSITGASSFEIFFPVLENHWSGAHMLLGFSPRTGVTLNCTGQPTTNFRCHGEHMITTGDDVASIGFSAWTMQFELSSAASAQITMNVAGGVLQECNSHSGKPVNIDAAITTSPGVSLVSTEWLIDGVSAGSGASIQPVLSLGAHTVRLTVNTDDGASLSVERHITIQDTTKPVVLPAFISPFTGAEQTVISTLYTFVSTFFNVSDICDPSPVVKGVYGAPASDGDLVLVTRYQGSVRLQTDTLSLDVTATDASGNTGMGTTEISFSN